MNTTDSLIDVNDEKRLNPPVLPPQQNLKY
jgi:hypothetical protein